MSRSWALGILVLALVGCDQRESRTMTSPSPPDARPPSPPPSTATTSLSGVVYEHTSTTVRPLAGAAIEVSAYETQQTAKTTTDANGRYVITDLAHTRALKAAVEKNGYAQPCFTPVAGEVVDLHVVPVALLIEAGIPPSLPLSGPLVTGRVYERTAQGPAPNRRRVGGG